MKIKIIKIHEKKPVYQPEGKNYKIFNFICQIDIDGKNIPYTSVKTFSEKIEIIEGHEYEVERKEFNGDVSYNVMTSKKTFQPENYKKINQMDFETFEVLCKKCFSLAFNLNREKPELFFDKILGCASVMIDPEKIKNEGEKNEKVNV
jgi:hypothetical protein